MPKSSRKSFLAAAASSVLIAAAPPSPHPSGSPSPKPKPQQVSEAAHALAASMRKFDPDLSDKALETIARNIDGNLKIGSAINPKGTKLRNWDEPATTFEAAE